VLAKGRTAEVAMGTTMSKGYDNLHDANAFGATKYRNQRSKGADASRYINRPRLLAHGLTTGRGATDLEMFMDSIFAQRP
jgi:hypothetical protein